MTEENTQALGTDEVPTDTTPEEMPDVLFEDADMALDSDETEEPDESEADAENTGVDADHDDGEDDQDDSDADADADEDDDEDGLWPGDTGTLPFNVRRVLVALLRGPCLRRDRHPKLWRVLLTNESVIRSRVSDLILDLLLDEEAGVAMLRRPETGDLKAPSLLHTQRLNFLDSCALLELREKMMRNAGAADERTVVTPEEIAEALKLYDRTALKDEQAFRRHVSGVISRLTTRRLLLPLRGTSALEVSPTLPRLFAADDVAKLMAAYQEKANRVGGTELDAEDALSAGNDNSAAPTESPAATAHEETAR